MRFAIGAWVFATKGEAQATVRKLLWLFEPGQVIEDATATEFLTAVLALHPRATKKVGVGIRHFYVARDSYGGQGFHFERVDGTRDNFSYLSCFRPKTARENALSALRNEVHGQVLAFKNAQFGLQPFVPCALTGVPVSKENCHVDHVIRFTKLVGAFEKIEGVDVAQLCVDDTPRAGFRADALDACFLVDRALAQRWFDYHQTHAVLRITSAEANLSRGRDDDT